MVAIVFRVRRIRIHAQYNRIQEQIEMDDLMNDSSASEDSILNLNRERNQAQQNETNSTLVPPPSPTSSLAFNNEAFRRKSSSATSFSSIESDRFQSANNTVQSSVIASSTQPVVLPAPESVQLPATGTPSMSTPVAPAQPRFRIDLPPLNSSTTVQNSPVLKPVEESPSNEATNDSATPNAFVERIRNATRLRRRTRTDSDVSATRTQPSRRAKKRINYKE